jgi:predicted Mrr-cat superfamily restriction endonuclease
MSRNAFVLRIAPSEIDRVEEALKSGDAIIGWSGAKGLLDASLTWERFREIGHATYYSSERDYTRAGRAAGSLWRFIREMNDGDLVVVPHGSELLRGRDQWSSPAR